MQFELIVVLALLEIIGECHKIENKSKFGGKLSFQDFFIVFMIVSFPINFILYKCQICLHETEENAFK